jgi:hypothetical protein
LYERVARRDARACAGPFEELLRALSVALATDEEPRERGARREGEGSGEESGG